MNSYLSDTRRWDYTPWPGGQRLDTLRSMSYQSINPFNSEFAKSFEEHTDRQLETATVPQCAIAFEQLLVRS